MIDTKGLSLLIQEASALSNKPRWTSQDEKRNAFLLSAISAVKAGATLEEVDTEHLNEIRRANGVEVKVVKSNRREAEVRGWREAAEKSSIERRDMGEGAPMINHIGTYTGLGYFVPTDFFPQVFAAMKAHDALFDAENVTFISSTNGRPLPIPTYDDTEIVASVVSEAGLQSSVDIDATSQTVLGAYSYSTPRFVCSMEALQDTEAGISVIDLFKQFSADRLARGIGADLVTGSGINKPLGLVPAIEALGVTPVVASGSSPNTGGIETGANSLGSADFSAALGNLDRAYFGPKTAWLMNQQTLSKVSGITDKYGNILQLVKYVDGVPTIFGIPVKICPTMDNIGVSNVPVVLGDLSYWATRLVVDGTSGIRVFREAPGLVENGQVAFRTFVRAHGALLYSGVAAQSPFTYIRNFS
jgi:HK97 family phage major capsid protein